MKLLIICAVLSICVAVSLAGPVEKVVRDELDSLTSVESGELKIVKDDSSSSSSEEEKYKVQTITVRDSSIDSSEELPEDNELVKDATDEKPSVEDQSSNENFIISRAKRAVNFAPHVSNRLSEDEKYLKPKLLKFALAKDFQDRNKRNADTSEDNSTEENKKHTSQSKVVLVGQKPDTVKPETVPAKGDFNVVDIRRKRNSPDSGSSGESSEEDGKEAASANGVSIAKKPETAPTETLQLDAKTDAAPVESVHKSETLRRRRSVDDTSEENLTQQTKDENEVFILSKEKQANNEDNNSEDFENNEPAVWSGNNFETSDSFLENKNSEEDYAQGCGGNRSDNSNEDSNENNETL